MVKSDDYGAVASGGDADDRAAGPIGDSPVMGIDVFGSSASSAVYQFRPEPQLKYSGSGSPSRAAFEMAAIACAPISSRCRATNPILLR